MAGVVAVRLWPSLARVAEIGMPLLALLVGISRVYLGAHTLGLTTLEIFLVVALFSLVITLTSTGGGALSDRLGRHRLIVAGWLIYATIYLGFAFDSARWHVWALYAGYAVYYGAFHGAASALVADLVPEELRGTAYGIFNGVLGAAAFPASLLAGLLWDWYGPAAPFLAGGGLALTASGGLLLITSRSRHKGVPPLRVRQTSSRV